MEQAATPAAGVDLSPAATDLGRVHLLPCGIRHNSAAAVSDYFKPRDTGPCARPTPSLCVCLPSVRLVDELVRAGLEVDGVRVEEAFFRGRKLQGTTVALPDGYRGELLWRYDGDMVSSKRVLWIPSFQRNLFQIPCPMCLAVMELKCHFN